MVHERGLCNRNSEGGCNCSGFPTLGDTPWWLWFCIFWGVSVQLGRWLFSLWSPKQVHDGPTLHLATKRTPNFLPALSRNGILHGSDVCFFSEG